MEDFYSPADGQGPLYSMGFCIPHPLYIYINHKHSLCENLHVMVKETLNPIPVSLHVHVHINQVYQQSPWVTQCHKLGSIIIDYSFTLGTYMYVCVYMYGKQALPTQKTTTSYYACSLNTCTSVYSISLQKMFANRKLHVQWNLTL